MTVYVVIYLGYTVSWKIDDKNLQLIKEYLPLFTHTGWDCKDDRKDTLCLLSEQWAKSFIELLNDLAKKEESLQLQGILNLRKQTVLAPLTLPDGTRTPDPSEKVNLT